MRHLRQAAVRASVTCALLLMEGVAGGLGVGLRGMGASSSGTVRAMPAGTEGDSVVITPGQSLFLEPNVPNPFDRETVIAYTLDRDTKVILRIYDAFYNDVLTLVDEDSQPPGRYTVTFTPAGEYATAMYFYSLTTSAGTETRRMLLLR